MSKPLTCRPDTPPRQPPQQRNASLEEGTEQLGLRRRSLHVGAESGALGVVLLLIGTALPPVPPDSNDAAAAFATHAAVSRAAWLTVHLLRLAGITGIVLAMVLLSFGVATTARRQLWARL